MCRSVRIHQFGDAGVLCIENVEVGEPACGDPCHAFRFQPAHDFSTEILKFLKDEK